MATVTLKDIKKSFGATDVIHGIDAQIADGEFIVIVGPSGCGKSTLLRMVAGLETVSGGEVQIGGQRANDKEPMDRDIAMVFQNYALYPHMSVRQNMGYGLKIAKLPKDQIEAKVVAAGVGPDGPVKLGVRPEHLLVQDDGAIRVQVRMAEPLGANTLLHGAVDGVSGNFTASLQGVHLMDQPSKELRFAIQPDKAHLFDVDTGLRRVT